MHIAVSACLLGENCKYNGGNNYSEALAAFLRGHDYLRRCFRDGKDSFEELSKSVED